MEIDYNNTINETRDSDAHFHNMKKALSAFGLDIDDYNWGGYEWNEKPKELYRSLFEDLAEKWNQ